jgi:hypothetical protein
MTCGLVPFALYADRGVSSSRGSVPLWRRKPGRLLVYFFACLILEYEVAD